MLIKSNFLLFPLCFLPCFFETFCHFSSTSKLSSANASILEESKICRLGKGLSCPSRQNVSYSETSFVRRTRETDFSFELSKVRTLEIYENIERKGEIVRNEQFLLSPQSAERVSQ